MRQKFAFLLLAAFVLTAVPGIPSRTIPRLAEGQPEVKAAQKSESESPVIKNIMLGSDCIAAPETADDVYGWRGDRISFGKKKWRVLDPATSDYNSTEENRAGKKKILLQRETAVKESSLTDYSGVAAMEEDLTAGEAKAVSASEKYSAGISGQGSPLTGEKFFLLDETEATNPAYGYGNAKSRISNLLENGETWWLRSSSSAEICKYVETDGTIVESNTAESKGIRPAMTLDPVRILFVSPTANDFSFYKDEEFRMVQNHFGVVSANTWKLTLQGVDEAGAEVSSLDAAVSSGTFAPGNKVTLTHRAADMLSGATQVTAALYTESDGVLYYGRINDDVTATTSELTLPEEMKPGTYRLLVFGEDVNFGANTDYTTAVNLGEAIEFTIEPEYVMGSGDTLFSEKVGNSSYRNIKRDTCQTVEVDNHGIEPKVVNGKKRLTVPFTFTDGGSKTPATQVSFLIVGDAVGETSAGDEILMHGQVWYRVPEGEASLSFDLPEWYEGETIYVCTEKVTSGKNEGYASELVRLEFADANWTENDKRDRIISIIVEEQTDASDECAVTLSDGRANDTVFSVDDFVISKTGSNRTDVEEGVTVEAINGKNQVQGAGEVMLTVKVDKEFDTQDAWRYLWWKKKLIGEFRIIKRVITTRDLEKTYNPKVGGSQLTAEEREELPILREAGSNAQILFYTDKECTTLVGSREDTVSGINYYGAMPPGAGKVGDEPIDAGTYYYRIEMFPSERNKGTVTTTRTFTIHKASATIKAADQTIEVGDNISQEPSVGLESCYIDTRMNYYVQSVVLTPDSLEMNVADNRIMPSDARIYCHKHWETVSVDVTKNFDITYEPGRLTVTEKVLVPTPTPEPDTDDVETETEPEPEPDSEPEPEPEGNKPEYEADDIQKPDKPVIRSAKRNKTGKKITLFLKKKVKGAMGYQVVYASNRKFKNKKTKMIKGLKATLSGISKKKPCYIRVRAYITEKRGKRVYGGYSKVKCVK